MNWGRFKILRWSTHRGLTSKVVSAQRETYRNELADIYESIKDCDCPNAAKSKIARLILKRANR